MSLSPDALLTLLQTDINFHFNLIRNQSAATLDLDTVIDYWLDWNLATKEASLIYCYDPRPGLGFYCTRLGLRPLDEAVSGLQTSDDGGPVKECENFQEVPDGTRRLGSRRHTARSPARSSGTLLPPERRTRGWDQDLFPPRPGTPPGPRQTPAMRSYTHPDSGATLY